MLRARALTVVARARAAAQGPTISPSANLFPKGGRRPLEPPSSRWLRLADAPAAFPRAWGVGSRQRRELVGGPEKQGNGGQGAGAAGRRGAAMLGALGLAGISIVQAWRVYGQAGPGGRLLPPAIMEPPDGFGEQFEHPYKGRSLIVRLAVTSYRIVFLSWCFARFALASLMLVVFGGSVWRERWLAEMISGLEEAGCAFQKFGQWLSMRPDMIADDVIKALSTLRQDAPEHTLDETRRVVREEWGKEIEDVFETFDPKPVASGSVAQVHKARLREECAMEGGVRDVAVKVRHPKVLQETYVDIELIFAFITSLGEVAGHLTIPFTKDEFQQILQKQIDFRWEAYNLSRFRHNFHEERSLVFPAVCDELLSPGILVESWIPGSTMSSIFTDVGSGLKEVPQSGPQGEGPEMRKQKARFAKTLFDMTMKMFLRDNLVHGDLHGGNVMFVHESDIVGIVDGGLVTGVEREVRGAYIDFLKALCRGDADALVERLVGFSERRALTAEELQAFRSDVTLTVQRWVAGGRDPEGGPIQLGDMVGELLFTIQKHKMSLRGDVAGTIVSMSLCEGIVKQLDPSFDIVGTALPYFAKYPLRPE